MMYVFSALNKKIKFYNKLTVDYNENIGNVKEVLLNTALWQWQLYLAQVYKFSKSSAISLITQIYSPQLSDFYTYKEGLQTDFKYSFKLCKNKIDATIRLNDLFNTYFFKLSGDFDNYKSYRYSNFSRRGISFSIRYNFQSGKKNKSKPIDIDNSSEENRITNQL